MFKVDFLFRLLLQVKVGKEMGIKNPGNSKHKKKGRWKVGTKASNKILRRAQKISLMIGMFLLILLMT